MPRFFLASGSREVEIAEVKCGKLVEVEIAEVEWVWVSGPGIDRFEMVVAIDNPRSLNNCPKKCFVKFV